MKNGNSLTANERAALEQLKAILTRDFKLVELKLFGSKARGDAHRESDIDVLVVLEECDWKTEYAVYDICYDLSVDHDVVITPVVYSRADFVSPLRQATPFHEAVVREGVAL
jgi:predicted nucleotidyltransferase